MAAMTEKVAYARARRLATEAREALHKAEADLDEAGLFGIGGAAREARRKTERLLKWLDSSDPATSKKEE